MPAPSNLEEIIRKVVMEERAFTRACFAGIEDRLLPEKRLRPPLAADRAPERTPSAPGPSTAPAQREPKGKGKGKGKKTTPAAPTAQTVPQDLPREDPLLPSTTPSNQPWVKVVSKKRKGKKKVAPKPPAAKPAAVVEKRKKLPLPPKSAAVVVTLTPEAAERGETYESVLRRARANVDPAQLGAGSSTSAHKRTSTELECVLLKNRLRMYESAFLRRDSFCDSMFGGVLLTRVECTDCHSSSLSRDVFRDLQLAFSDKPEGWQHNVQNLLQREPNRGEPIPVP
ncbi:hypothetical protein HF086_008977 [Spodoptera exigua]|uniref:USP domain-containing protein n=1 Tax=Spodoptera exigua TaxID=7107 RepID=A0A922MUK1_SPOEX|nr:hypothetical protein HF086_008977 [Spodoptera exigua]